MFDRDMPEPTDRVVVNVPEGSPCWMVFMVTEAGEGWSWGCDADERPVRHFEVDRWEDEMEELQFHLSVFHPELLP